MEGKIVMNSSGNTLNTLSDASEYRQPGGRLAMLVNNVCDVIGTRRNLQEMSFMADFFRSVTTSLITEEVLEVAARKIYEYFRYNLMVVTLTSGAEERIMAYSPRDIENAPEDLAAILRNYVGLRAHDVKGYRILGLDGPEGSLVFGNTNYLEIPLNLGSITIYSEFNFINHFSDEMLQGLMETFATALRNSLEYGKVKELSMRDGLTGLFNRRVLEEMLEMEGCKRQVSPLSLLVIDLDNFKLINDTYGHPAGDLVLQTVARVLRECTRGSDLVVRSGGEEFSALLSAVSPLGGLEVAERIRVNLAKNLVTYNGRQIRMSASIGVAHRSEKNLCTMKELAVRADQALYEAKRQGKNRVCVYSKGTGLTENSERPNPETKDAQIVRIK
ncbi:MAG: GGDEF domain-containing protein [Deltaproteobacteria bacterium]|nr:GGDEF domain-containing protein [Deltaproteobacteria bacterium]TLN04784.1 MAG: GGDEF domain-containing protein [bacterium]